MKHKKMLHAPCSMLYTEHERGAAMMIAVIFFIVISAVIVLGLTGPSAREYAVANRANVSRQSYFLAESGAEDAFYRVKTGKALGSSTTLTLNGSSASTAISSPSTIQRQITATGIVSSLQRKVQLLATNSTAVVFKYGTQVGQGGIIFGNGAYLDGSLYSNSSVTGSNNAYITGNTWVAGSGSSITNMCIGRTVSASSACTNALGSTYEVRAHTVTSSTVVGTIYCQSGSGNSSSCNTSAADPVELDLPVTATNIAKWKADAAAGTVVTGNVTISGAQTLGPEKIIGNLTVSGSGVLTIADTIWVTGNVTFSGSGGGSQVKLGSAYGSQSGIILSDGLINIGNNITFADSGTTGSYIMLLTTSSCDQSTSASPCSSNNAIEISNNANIVIANAQSGTVHFSNNATVKEVVGNKIRLNNNVGISYGTGSITVGFTSGSSSWATNSWKETQ